MTSWAAVTAVRVFSGQPVPRGCIDLAIGCANTAPIGAHLQPWKSAVIGDPRIRHQIRVAAEEEERQTYEGGCRQQGGRQHCPGE